MHLTHRSPSSAISWDDTERCHTGTSSFCWKPYRNLWSDKYYIAMLTDQCGPQRPTRHANAKTQPSN